jgi:hypothetical protein
MSTIITAVKPKSGPQAVVVPAPNDFEYHILRAFCKEMGWKKSQIEEEVLVARTLNAPADAAYRVLSTTGPGANPTGDKWVWRTIEELLSKSDMKERAFLAGVLALSSKYISKKAA